MRNRADSPAAVGISVLVAASVSDERGSYRAGTRMNAKPVVGVFEVLPDGPGRNPQQPRNLGVRLSRGDELQDLTLPRAKPLCLVHAPAVQFPPGGRVTTESFEVRKQDV